METDKIQERIDAIAKGMVAKAVPSPGADFSLRSHGEPGVYLHWTDKDPYKGHKFFSGPLDTVLAEAEAYVASLPSPEEAKMTAFLSVLSEAIELGKKNDIAVEHVNPLMALMKKLSKNALQHKPQESA